MKINSIWLYFKLQPQCDKKKQKKLNQVAGHFYPLLDGSLENTQTVQQDQVWRRERCLVTSLKLEKFSFVGLQQLDCIDVNSDLGLHVVTIRTLQQALVSTFSTNISPPPSETITSLTWTFLLEGVTIENFLLRVFFNNQIDEHCLIPFQPSDLHGLSEVLWCPMYYLTTSLSCMSVLTVLGSTFSSTPLFCMDVIIPSVVWMLLKSRFCYLVIHYCLTSSE